MLTSFVACNSDPKASPNLQSQVRAVHVTMVLLLILLLTYTAFIFVVVLLLAPT